MRLKTISTTLVISALSFTPTIAVFDLAGVGAAFAESENGNGNGNGAAKKADSVPVAVVGATSPDKLGKMNGAMHANINAVLAHIRNGQTTNGPVGLLAGLAVADYVGATAAADSAALQELAGGFDSLATALTGAGFASIETYLAAKADGTATADQIASIDPLVAAVGGLTTDGTGLSQVAPTAEEIQAAIDAATAAAAGVTAAEQAIAASWNKDGDLVALLVALRAKLSLNQAEIAAAIAGG